MSNRRFLCEIWWESFEHEYALSRSFSVDTIPVWSHCVPMRFLHHTESTRQSHPVHIRQIRQIHGLKIDRWKVSEFDLHHFLRLNLLSQHHFPVHFHRLWLSLPAVYHSMYLNEQVLQLPLGVKLGNLVNRSSSTLVYDLRGGSLS